MPRFTPSGIEPYNITYYREQLESIYRLVFGDDVDVDGDSIFGHIIGTDSIALANLDEAIVERAQIFDIDSARGSDLEQIGRFLNILRRLSVRTRVIGTLSGTAGTSIEAGSKVIARLPAGNVPFTLVLDVFIIAGGTVNGMFVSDIEGPIEVPIGLLNTIETQVPGWDSITNLAIQYVLGSGIESEENYRLRLKGLTPINSKNSKDALVAGILNLANIIKCVVIDNDTIISITVQGMTVPARSIMCIIYTSDSSTETYTAIATEIFRRKGLSIPTNGSESVTLVEEGNKVIKFQPATAVPITVTINLTTFIGFDGTSLESINQNLINFIKDLNLGDFIDQYRIQGVVTAIPFHNITTFTVVRKSGAGDVYTANSIDYDEIYTLALADITITPN